jgi:hypothetical protein
VEVYNWLRKENPEAGKRAPLANLRWFNAPNAEESFHLIKQKDVQREYHL